MSEIVCVIAACAVGRGNHRQGWIKNQTDPHGVWSSDHHRRSTARIYGPHYQHHRNTRPDSECTVPSTDEVQMAVVMSFAVSLLFL